MRDRWAVPTPARHCDSSKTCGESLPGAAAGAYRTVMNRFRLWAARRDRLYLPILIALPILVWAACLWLRPGDADVALRANFDRIEAGMSLDEAKGILGPP